MGSIPLHRGGCDLPILLHPGRAYLPSVRKHKLWSEDFSDHVRPKISSVLYPLGQSSYKFTIRFPWFGRSNNIRFLNHFRGTVMTMLFTVALVRHTTRKTCTNPTTMPLPYLLPSPPTIPPHTTPPTPELPPAALQKARNCPLWIPGMKFCILQRSFPRYLSEKSISA